MSANSPMDGPAPEALRDVFRVYEVRETEDHWLYFGEPSVPQEELLKTAWPLFRKNDLSVRLERRRGELVLVAEQHTPEIDGIPWLNIGLGLLTVFTTLLAGATWYYVWQTHDVWANPLALLEALPFVLSVLGVLGAHEFGHYALSRYHDVDSSLPYFIPMPILTGTMGAVIRMRGRLPSRKAQFDIGVAGPVAGLVATVLVTAVGLSLDPIAVPERLLNAEHSVEITLGYPLLFHGIAGLLGESLTTQQGMAMNPVVFGGWFGMLITFLNLLPAGQLDGGHMTRAMLGPTQARLAAVVPVSLFALGGYLYLLRDAGAWMSLWLVWGVLTSILVYSGPATPVSETPLGWRRVTLGLCTFLVGLLCFTPIPIRVVP